MLFVFELRQWQYATIISVLSSILATIALFSIQPIIEGQADIEQSIFDLKQVVSRFYDDNSLALANSYALQEDLLLNATSTNIYASDIAAQIVDWQDTQVPLQVAINKTVADIYKDYREFLDGQDERDAQNEQMDSNIGKIQESSAAIKEAVDKINENIQKIVDELTPENFAKRVAKSFDSFTAIESAKGKIDEANIDSCEDVPAPEVGEGPTFCQGLHLDVFHIDEPKVIMAETIQN